VFDRFGYSVATSGNALYAGSPSHQGKGALYGYALEAGAWTFQEKAQPSDLQVGDEFGFSLAASRNLVAVGAPGASQEAGAVYVYRVGPTSLVQEAKIVLAGSFRLGVSVDLWDDRMIVGEDGPAAHVYRRLGPGVWGSGPEATFLAPDGTSNIVFGESVALYQGHALVGDSEFTISGSTRPGAVYPYSFNGTAWVPGDRIDHPEPQPAAHFGLGIDIYGLYAVIGAYNQTLPDPTQGTGNLEFAGSAWVYRLEQGSWTNVQSLVSAAPNEGDLYGNSVSLDSGRMLVGAPGGGPGSGSISDGAVHLYELQQNGVWSPAGVLIPEDVQQDDSFGWDVALGTFVVSSAPNDQLDEAGPFTQEGSVYVASFE
jgi:hypothetical protein